MEIVMLHCLGKNKIKRYTAEIFFLDFFMLLVGFWNRNLWVDKSIVM